MIPSYLSMSITRRSARRWRRGEQVSRLAKKIDGKAGQGVKGGKSYPGPEVSIVAPERTRGGVVIDGVVYPLAGEPPLAVTHGWGRVPGF